MKAVERAELERAAAEDEEAIRRTADSARRLIREPDDDADAAGAAADLAQVSERLNREREKTERLISRRAEGE